MLHPDLLELHVEPAFEHVGQREPFVVPVQLFHVRPFWLEADHLGGELTAMRRPVSHGRVVQIIALSRCSVHLA